MPGIYSYGMYVFHLPLQPVCDRYAGVERLNQLLPSRAGAALVYVMICMTATFVVALLSWHLFESPILRLRKYFQFSLGSGIRR